MSDDPYHPGERSIQERTGERPQALAIARNIGTRISRPARAFVAQQHFCLLGRAGPEGDLWAAFLAGSQGFAATEESGQGLTLALADDVGVLPHLPPLAGLTAGAHLGVLFIELASRRRLRVNGRVRAFAGDVLTLDVDHAYALCPKYIQRRQLSPDPARNPGGGIERGRTLTPALAAWIAGADTFFVASAHPDGPADVSHRGGRPGFVRVADDVLTIPDYPGNSMFNTLGNFALNPRAGLVFVDFDGNRQLMLTGAVSLDLETEADVRATGGTRRWWHFVPERWIVAPLNRAFAWELLEESPFNP